MVRLEKYHLSCTINVDLPVSADIFQSTRWLWCLYIWRIPLVVVMTNGLLPANVRVQMRVTAVTVVATPCHATQTPGQNISLIFNHPVFFIFHKLDNKMKGLCFKNLIAIRIIAGSIHESD